MDSTQFTYWLKGFFEISDSNELTEKQVLIIKDHLDLVFTKVTPDRSLPIISPGNTTSTFTKYPSNTSVFPGAPTPSPGDGSIICSSSELPPSSYC